MAISLRDAFVKSKLNFSGQGIKKILKEQHDLSTSLLSFTLQNTHRLLDPSFLTNIQSIFHSQNYMHLKNMFYVHHLMSRMDALKQKINPLALLLGENLTFLNLVYDDPKDIDLNSQTLALIETLGLSSKLDKNEAIKAITSMQNHQNHIQTFSLLHPDFSPDRSHHLIESLTALREQELLHQTTPKAMSSDNSCNCQDSYDFKNSQNDHLNPSVNSKSQRKNTQKI